MSYSSFYAFLARVSRFRYLVLRDLTLCHSLSRSDRDRPRSPHFLRHLPCAVMARHRDTKTFNPIHDWHTVAALYLYTSSHTRSGKSSLITVRLSRLTSAGMQYDTILEWYTAKILRTFSEVVGFRIPTGLKCVQPRNARLFCRSRPAKLT